MYNKNYGNENIDAVLIAQPNLADITAEVQVEVANSPAYQCLEENFYKGLISGTEIALLKIKYAQLYEALTKTRDNEYELLQMSKKFIGILEVQQAELSKSDQFPENISTVVSRLRCDYLRTENTLMATDERVEKLLYKMELLKAEKKLLQREYSRMPKAELDNLGDEDIIEAMNRRTKTLTLENQELSIELDKLKRERYKMSENLRISLEQENEVKESKAVVLDTIEKTNNDLFFTSQLPGQYSKETEKLRRYKADAEKELASACEEHDSLTKYNEELSQDLVDRLNEIVIMKGKLSSENKEKLEKMKQIDELKKLTNLYKESELNLRTDKATQELQIQNSLSLKKEYLESVSRITKEKEKLVRTLKTSLLQLNISNESLYQTKQIFEKVSSKYASFPKDDTTWFDKRTKLTGDVTGIKVTLVEEATKESIIISRVHQAVADAERKLSILNNYRSENIEMVKLATKIAEKRENAANDYLNAERRHKKILEELEAKNQAILDQKKELENLKARATVVARLYSDIKMERNKCVALLQLTNQAHLENKEKIKLRYNEQGIIYKRLILHEKNIISLKKFITSIIIIRDNIRNEICKVSSVRIEQNYKREVMRLTIQRLNNMFNKIEADVIQTKKMTEKNILFRNERAMQLIERNEDVYILDERTKIQDSRYRNAQIELQSLIERITCLKRYQSELIHLIAMVKKKVPYQKQLQVEYDTLLGEYNAEKYKCSGLVCKVEDPSAPGRLRFLEGKDPDSDNLQKKVNIVELRFVTKEEELLEKDLLYEAVSRLVDQVQLRSTIGKEDTIKVAKSINHMKSKIMDIDKHIKVKAAELTIKISESNKLGKEIEKHNKQLNNRYERMERGQTPSVQIKSEFLKKEKHKNIRKEYKLNKNKKKRILPIPQSSRLFCDFHAPENRLPSIWKKKSTL